MKQFSPSDVDFRKNSILTKVAEDRAKKSFTHPSESTEQEALGIAISIHFEWNGIAIIKTFIAALEDANFHTEAAIASKWLNN